MEFKIKYFNDINKKIKYNNIQYSFKNVVFIGFHIMHLNSILNFIIK